MMTVIMIGHTADSLSRGIGSVALSRSYFKNSGMSMSSSPISSSRRERSS